MLAALVIIAQSFFGSLPIDGIRCDAQEGSAEHIHARLELFDRGRAVRVPAQVGIPQSGACLYWLHTHDTDGVIHIESPVRRTFTLGQFFDIWGPDVSWKRAGSIAVSNGRRLNVWVNGVPWRGRDPREIVLRDRETIVIQNGPPFAKPAPTDWSKF